MLFSVHFGPETVPDPSDPQFGGCKTFPTVVTIEKENIACVSSFIRTAREKWNGKMRVICFCFLHLWMLKMDDLVFL